MNIGNILYHQKSFPEAASSYQKAVTLDPRNPLAHNNLASVFKEQGIVDKAIYHFEKAFEFDPAYGLACRNLGDIYLNSGRPEKAKHWLKIAIKIDPENLYGHYWLGKAYYQFLELKELQLGTRSLYQFYYFLQHQTQRDFHRQFYPIFAH